MLVGRAFAQNSAWDFDVKVNPMDGKLTEIARTRSYGDSESASFIVRCKATCEAYLVLDRRIFADQESVRVRFNSSAPTRFSVNRGEGSDSLFFRNPMALLKAIRDNGGYATVEFSPYEQVPTTAKFGVWNLPPTILARLDKWERQQKKAQAADKRAKAAEDSHEAFCTKLHATCLHDDDWDHSPNCTAYKEQCK
jgi:hypothetical protein